MGSLSTSRRAQLGRTRGRGLQRGLTACLLLFAACAGLPRADDARVDAGAPLSDIELGALRAEADALWAARDQRGALAAALEAYPRLAEREPDDPRRRELCVRVARAHAFFARAHGRDAAERTAHWEAGAAWGERALGLAAPVRAAVARGDDVLDVLDELDAEHAGALYWTAINLASWAEARGLAALIGARERFKAYMLRVEQLDAEGFDGGVQRFLAIDLASAPALAGGDAQAARERFERALEIEPRRFENHVLFAERWALPERDPALARALLRAVLAADPSNLPGREPEQRVEQARAAALLATLEG